MVLNLIGKKANFTVFEENPITADPKILKDLAAYFLKVWPEREPVCSLTPAEFDPVICKIQESHCG